VWGRYNRDEVMKLTRLLKQHLINPLIDALCEEEDASVRKLFMHVLSAFKSDLLPEASRRLGDERWYVVRNMIYLLRECDDPAYVDAIRPFLQSRDARISMEALKTMLHFREPEGISQVRSNLLSKDAELLDRGIKLAGSYRVREVIPDLLRLFEKREGFRVNVPVKQSILKALADIGDPQALDTLSRVYHSRPLFFRKAADALKIEIFKSLHQYPSASIKPLIESGLRSRNREIRALCENLLKSKEG
jgi:HEAT repeat protein